jgi:tetratricopeptide (TPR) repeat protein
VIYQELRPLGVEFVAVAFETGGAKAAAPWIRPPDLSAIPTNLYELMGWGEREIAKLAPPTYTCLIDERHVVADLYGMTNVPMAVWIDEQGKIVRPPESAGASDAFRKMDTATFQLPPDAAAEGKAARQRYSDALRDWAKNGAKSRYALPPDEVRKRMRGPSESDAEAAAWAALGASLHRRGDVAGAKAAFAKAVALEPESWNYRRQGWMLDPELVGELNGTPEFFAAVQALGAKPYYPPPDL